MFKPLNILVVGATGGTGQETVAHLVAAGHKVTAFARTAERLHESFIGIRTVNGDASRPEDLSQAVRDQDAVIVTLDISENPFRVRLFGAARTPADIRSAGTRNVIAAMQKHGVRRLVVLSSYGVGATRSMLGFVDRLFFNLILKPQIVDTERQELEVRDSGIDWVIAQPVYLTDNKDDAAPFISIEGKARKFKVARRAVAGFLALATNNPNYVGRSVAISG